MPIYISRGRFTPDAVKGMVAKPENRKEAVSKLFESVGGRLIEWYLTFGRHDWLVIGEFPDDKAAAAAVLAAAAGGSLSDVETTPAMTAEDAHHFRVRRKGSKSLPECRAHIGSGRSFSKRQASAFAAASGFWIACVLLKQIADEIINSRCPRTSRGLVAKSAIGT